MSCQNNSCQDLQKKLTPQQYKITQEKGTERVSCMINNSNISCIFLFLLILCNHRLSVDIFMTTMKRELIHASVVITHYSGKSVLYSFKILSFNISVCSSSETKFDSGSGWPSFYKTIEVSKLVESVERITDSSHGMIRVEVVCRNVSVTIFISIWYFLICVLFYYFSAKLTWVMFLMMALHQQEKDFA